ncbi:MAG: hypothetical protein ACO3JL_08330, partial [Myxococcota bacterium]
MQPRFASQTLPFPPSPGADELSLNTRQRLLDEAFTLVEKRARPAATTYLLVCAVVGFATPYPHDHPRVYWGLFAMYAVLAVL